jgi:predicted TPR repeat methyltransferase
VDALRRVGDAEAALELIAEAPDAWPTEDARWRRVGTAQAMLGQYAPALEMLQNTLQKRPEDPDILFLAIQVLYRQHLESPLPSAARDTFADYAARYEKVKGPELALVNSWRRFLLR